MTDNLQQLSFSDLKSLRDYAVERSFSITNEMKETVYWSGLSREVENEMERRIEELKPKT